MSYTQKLRNTANSFTGRARQRIALFWGTHDNKYIVTHDNKRILFFEKGGFTVKGRSNNVFTNKPRA